MNFFFLNNYLVLCNRVSNLIYPELSAEGLGRADMNDNGEVNIFDVILVLRKALGLD